MTKRGYPRVGLNYLQFFSRKGVVFKRPLYRGAILETTSLCEKNYLKSMENGGAVRQISSSIRNL